MFNVRKLQEKAIYEAVQTYSDALTAEEIVYGSDKTASNENDAEWVKSTMCRLENKFDEETRKKLRMDCQCGYGMEDRVNFITELVAASSNMEEFANSDKAMAAGLYCEQGTLYLKFQFCPCPILAGVDKLETNTWCLCTTGYSKILFEKAFGCEVKVELLKSIKMGHDICLMKIIPQGSIWK